MEHLGTTQPQTPLSPEKLEERVSALQRKLAESGHRTTPQRLHILRALLETDTHPTAEDVWEKVRRISPTTSLGTIYKTLDTLEEMGEVMGLDTRGDCRHYDAIRPIAHPHIVCTGCGRIQDVEVDGLGTLQSQAAAASGFVVAEQHVTFYGLCRDCQDAS